MAAGGGATRAAGSATGPNTGLTAGGGATSGCELSWPVGAGTCPRATGGVTPAGWNGGAPGVGSGGLDSAFGGVMEGAAPGPPAGPPSEDGPAPIVGNGGWPTVFNTAFIGLNSAPCPPPSVENVSPYWLPTLKASSWASLLNSCCFFRTASCSDFWTPASPS